MVNNAGIATFTEIEWCSVDQFQRILDVNVLGVVRVTKAFLPLLRYSHGRVVNVASLAGKHAVFGLYTGSMYCPSFWRKASFVAAFVPYIRLNV